MRIAVVNKGKPFESIYIQKDIYLKDVRNKSTARKGTGKDRTTVTVEKLGKVTDLMKEMNMTHDEVIQWARNKAIEMTEAEKAEPKSVTVTFRTDKRIEKDQINSFNVGYLFLQRILYDLRIDNICRNIKGRHDFDFDILSILTDLVYARILEPCSKKSSFAYCDHLLERPQYDLHQVYRALSVLAKESDYIQAEIYKNSNHVIQRNNHVLYYDCTNYFFETEEGDGFREYGKSKENRNTPIVQMGLFMDGDGIPLCFSVFPGNSNEQPSLKPLEEKIINNFGFDQFVVCTDGGLGSDNNRQFNDIEGRAFITTQSLKKLKAKEREAAMDDRNWRRLSDGALVDISEIRKEPERYTSNLYYKEETYGTKKVPGQLMIVTYSPKYAIYQKNIRDKQVERAEKMIKTNNVKREKKNPHDPARFVSKLAVTADGEVAEDTTYFLNETAIAEEAYYDGYYAVCTDLVNDSVEDILKVSERRWEIEESFRIMKTDFRTRPVYVYRKDRIEAHFLICYLALLVYRLLEKKLNEEYTTEEIISTLRNMNVTPVLGAGYKPAYTRTDLTDRLHEVFGFFTDMELTTKSQMKTIISESKMKTNLKRNTKK